MQAYIRVRVRATGQVIDMVPMAARALLNARRVELVEDGQVETAAVSRSQSTATAPAQHSKPRKAKHA